MFLYYNEYGKNTWLTFSEVILKLPVTVKYHGYQKTYSMHFDLLSSTWLSPWIWKFISLFVHIDALQNGVSVEHGQQFQMGEEFIEKS